MDQLDINEHSTSTANEETKDTTEPKKKRIRKPKAATEAQEESKAGPATRTRGRLAAFLS